MFTLAVWAWAFRIAADRRLGKVAVDVQGPWKSDSGSRAFRFGLSPNNAAIMVRSWF